MEQRGSQHTGTLRAVSQDQEPASGRLQWISPLMESGSDPFVSYVVVASEEHFSRLLDWCLHHCQGEYWCPRVDSWLGSSYNAASTATLGFELERDWVLFELTWQ